MEITPTIKVGEKYRKTNKCGLIADHAAVLETNHGNKDLSQLKWRGRFPQEQIAHDSFTKAAKN